MARNVGRDGTAGAPLTAACRGGGSSECQGRAPTKKQGRFPGVAGRPPGRSRSRNSSNDGTAGAPLTRHDRAAAPRAVPLMSGNDGSAGAPLTAPGRAAGRRGAGERAATKKRGGVPRGLAVGRRVADRLGLGEAPPFTRSGHTGRVLRCSGIESGDIATQCAIGWRYHHSRWRTPPPRRSPANQARGASRLSGSDGGAGPAHARSGPRDRAGARWWPDQNGIRCPRPLLPAHRTRLRRSRSPRVTGGGATPTRGPAPGGRPAPASPPPPCRRADEQGHCGHRGTESRSGLAGIAPGSRRGAPISAPPLAPPL